MATPGTPVRKDGEEVSTEIWEAGNLTFPPLLLLAALLIMAAVVLALLAREKQGKTKVAFIAGAVVLIAVAAIPARAGYPVATTEHAVTHETLKAEEISGDGIFVGRYAVVEGKAEKVYIPFASAINYADTLEVYCLEGEEQQCIAIGKTDDPEIAIEKLLGSGLFAHLVTVEKVS